MSTLTSSPPPTTTSPSAKRRVAAARLNRRDARANQVVKYFAIGAAALVFFVMFAMVFTTVDHAGTAFHKFGLGFLIHGNWDPQAGKMGAGPLIFGTLLTSALSVAMATVLGTAIGLFLAMMAPKRIAAVVGPLVEMLAAIPSIVVGMLGIAIFAPFIAHHVEPTLHSVLGFLPFFGKAQPVGQSAFTASLVLAFMVLPLVSSLSRDIFATVPSDLMDGAEALGATRWEVIRGVVIPTTVSGVTSAVVLGFGRALGEAIAVEQVVGGQVVIHGNIFQQSDTLGSRLAGEFADPISALHLSTLYYLALILLVLGILTNVLAGWISARTQMR